MKTQTNREIKTKMMQSMRDSGMTNRQIATALKCHNATVWSYIGKMPKELRRGAKEAAASIKPAEPAKAVEPAKPVEVVKTVNVEKKAAGSRAVQNHAPEFVIEDKSVTLRGSHASYCVHGRDMTIDVSFDTDGRPKTFGREELHDFMSELCSVSRRAYQMSRRCAMS